MTQLIEQKKSFSRSEIQMKPVRVMIVDDSKLIRRAVRGFLESESGVSVVGEAENGAQALDLVSKLKPDVITLDINMPVMDGISTIKHLMIKSPLPTVMLSTFAEEGTDITFDALRYGAMDFMQKPSRIGDNDWQGMQKEIFQRVKTAAGVSVDKIRYVRIPKPSEYRKRSSQTGCKFVVGIGASEGGYRPLLNLIPHLDPRAPVAYIAVFYTGRQYLNAFAKYLSVHSKIDVTRAKDGMHLSSGTCYLLTGDEYTTLSIKMGHPALRVHPTPFPDRRGSINMLLFSLAETFNHNAAGIILSGLGEDGSEGLREIKRHGGRTLVQDPTTCLYKEMPISAIQSCEGGQVVSDMRIAAEINTLFFN